MPVIRYRTRDLTRLLPGTARPGFRRMEKVTGRSDDMMIIRGVNVFPTQIEELILAQPALAPHFQCVLTRPDRLDELEVLVEARSMVDDRDRTAYAAELAAQIKARIGVTAAVTVVPPGSVERSVGKMRRIVDNRGIGRGWGGSRSRRQLAAAPPVPARKISASRTDVQFDSANV